MISATRSTPVAQRARLAWRPPMISSRGLARTVDWYLANRAWWGRIRAARYAGQRLGQNTTAKVAA